MKRALAFCWTMAMLFCCFPIIPLRTSAAANGTCGDGLTWVLDDAGTLTISGVGLMEDYSLEYPAPWYDYQSDIMQVVIELGVATIGNEAFYSCAGLSAVAIPDSVTAIGSRAFAYCSGVSQITIGKGVETIEYDAFDNCSDLTGIWVSEDNTAYSSDAMGVLFDKNKTVLRRAPEGLSGSYTIPDGVTTIEHYAFSNCSGLTGVMIPDSVTAISNHAFSRCSGLTSITIPDGVTTIYRRTFYSCKDLTCVGIPESVTAIDSMAFYSCNSLTDVYYGGSADQWAQISIGTQNAPLQKATLHTVEPVPMTGIAIKSLPVKTDYWVGEALDTTGLSLTVCYADGTTVEITEGFTVSGFASAVAGTQTVTVTYEEMTAVFDVTVVCGGVCGDDLIWVLDSDGTLTISGTGAMVDYTPDGDAPWYGDRSKVIKAVIEPGVAAIGAYAFYSCANMTSVDIPASMTLIGKYAFSGCSGLNAVHITDIAAWCNIDFGGRKEKQAEPVSNGNAAVVPYAARAGSVVDMDKLSAINAANPLRYAGNLYLDDVLVTELVIPHGVTVISSHAFHFCSSLTSVTIPSGVTAISNYAFTFCDNLASVTIPRSVTSIGRLAFDECVELSDVYYRGDADQWAQISIGSYNDPLTGAARHYVVPVVSVSGSTNGTYDSLAEAVKNAAAGDILKLLENVQESITVHKNLYLDLNGCDINGTVTVAAGCTLYGMDTMTNDFTIEDGDGYGKITGVDGAGTLAGLPEESAAAEDGYLMVTETDGISFHCVRLKLLAVSLRANDCGIYYKSQFAGDELVSEKVIAFGVALSVKGIPVAETMGNSSVCSAFTDFSPGINQDAKTSTLLKSVMKTTNSPVANAGNCKKAIYGRAYIQTEDGYMFGATASRTFQEQVESVDLIWSELSDIQKTAVLNMYSQYKDIMDNWDIPAIKLAAQG